MSTLQNGDSFLVQRTDPQSGISTNYQVSQENLMANLADDDLLLVQRTSAGISTNYSITGSALKQDLGGVSGLIIPDVEVLTPINGAGITEFDRYVPISSAITAVGEAGTIAKETDAIQSVADVGSGSVLFNDSDDYLTLSTNSDFKFGTSDFTIECFVKPETLNTNAYSSYFSTILDFDGGTGNYAGAWFAIHQNHTQVFWASDNANQLGGGQLTLDWNHIAVTRSSGTTSLYVNGSWVVSHTDNNNYTDSETRGLYIGTQNGTDRRFGGSISNLRIVKGTALYTGTGNFTPPTSSLGAVNNTKLLCCQSTTSVTEATVSPGTITTGGSPTVGVGPVSGKLLSFPTNTNFSGLSVGDIVQGSVDNGGSLYLDGDAVIKIASNASAANIFNIQSSQAFTIEAWVYPTSLGTYNNIMSGWDASCNRNGVLFHINGDGQIFFGGLGGSIHTSSASNPVTVNNWHHVAVTRNNGGDGEFYIDGVSAGSFNNPQSAANHSCGVFIGANMDGHADGSGGYAGYRWNGYISNLRYVVGHETYTSGFTPPTEPLTPTSQNVPAGACKFLALQDATSFDTEASGIYMAADYGTPVASEQNPFGTSATPVAITSIDGAATPPTISVGGGTWTTGDRLTSQVSYEKSLTFTDPAELDNMVAPLEMTDANGDVVTAVSDTITNVNGNVLTLQSNTNLAYFQPGDEVQTGVQVVSVDTYAPSITVDGGNWKGADGSGSAYEIPKSLRFDSLYKGNDSSAKNYLSRTPTSEGNRKTFTWSGWVKQSLYGGSYQAIFTAGTSGYIEGLWFGSTEEIYVSFYENGGTTRNLYSEAKFRDYANWQHIVLSVDTTQSTSTDRVKLYVNGVQQTFTGNSSFPSHYAETRYINNTISHFIGANPSFNYPFGGYLADVHFIDGQVVAPTVFGGFDSNGVWQPKPASISSYGVNGFHLFFDDSSNTTIGYDTAGSNNWSATNISVSGADNDRLADSPTSNYATLNPLFDGQNGSEFSNGNLTYSHNQGVALGTIPFGKTGKWYFEVEMIGDNAGIGVALSEAPSFQYLGHDSNSWSYYSNMNNTSGGKYTNYTSHGTVTPYGSGYTTGDVIGVAFDSDAGELSFYKNGASQGVAFTGFNDGKDYFPAVGSGSVNVNLNFGQRPFAYPAPSGYKAINLANMPEPTIKNGSQHFDTVTYTGNGSTKTISGLEFSPDLIWVRYRGSGISHILYDTVRGLGPLKGMNPDLTRAEGACHDKQSGTGFGYVSAAHSDGFTVVNGDQSNGYVNYSGHEYVAWCWNAGNTTVTNNNGSISSQVRANPEAGFSIVSYAGSQSTGTYTIGHGLNKQPEFIITKARNDGGNDWGVYYAANGVNTNWMSLNRTNKEGSNSNSEMGGAWVAANSSTIEIDQLAFANVASSMIAYCFAPVEGYSSMGSYIGNGSTEQGPFVYTGFKPAWIIIKCSSDSGNAHWVIFDSERDGFNPVSKTISANGNDQEYGYSDGVVGVDFLSNGFTLRDNNSSRNGASQTYIYMAFAENPTKTTGGTSGSGDTQVTFNLAATATDVLEVDGTTMYLNGATGPWRTGLHIEGSEVNATPPGPSEITFTSQNQGTPAFSGVDATLASRTWTLESGTAATGPWTLVDTYSDFGVLNTQTGATPWTENKPTLQPNTYYRIKVKYNSTNAESVESVYNTFKTGPNS